MARSTSSSVAASGTAQHAVPGRSLALHILLSLRPAQWSKNLLVFAGLLFGRRLLNLTKRITDLLSITKLLTVFETYDSENDAVRSFSASAKV